MTHPLIHEQIYRGEQAIEKLAIPKITLCGAGAIGSQLADNLLRQGLRSLCVIDDDRIEEHNVGTQIYDIADVGARKVDILRSRIFRAVSIEIDATAKRLEQRNARKLLKGADLVIDTFDNSESRNIVRDSCDSLGIACLHVGLNTDYCEAIWNASYRVPDDVAGDVCEYPLARNLVVLAVAIASESIVRWVLGGEQTDWTMTIGDFAINKPETPLAASGG